MKLDRRQFLLRGLGVAIALPKLDMFDIFSSVARAAAPKAAAKRLAVFYVPNGIVMPNWTPKTEGNDSPLPKILPPTLSPLAPYRDNLLVLSGLDQVLADAKMPGDHARAASTFLTGVRIAKTGGLRAGISMDQIAARTIGRETRFPSLQLGCEAKQTGECNAGYSCVYTTSISWETEETPMFKESDPKVAFESLFAGPKREEAIYGQKIRASKKKSILDFVLDDTASLRNLLGKGDQRKVDEYLQSVRQVEKQILNQREAELAPELTKKFSEKPANYTYPLQIDLLIDLIVLAFQTDATRICTFMLADEFSNRAYPFLKINDGHHELSHDRGIPDLLNKLSQINQFHVGKLAHFLKRLAETPDGQGNLLDSTLVMYGSGLSNGNLHKHTDLPILLAGNAQGAIKSGRHIRYPEGTPLCNLHLAVLDLMGVNQTSLGDSNPKVTRGMNLS